MGKGGGEGPKKENVMVVEKALELLAREDVVEKERNVYRLKRSQLDCKANDSILL